MWVKDNKYFLTWVLDLNFEFDCKKQTGANLEIQRAKDRQRERERELFS